MTGHYTGQLNFDFSPHFELWAPESDLADLPTGTVTLGGVTFDVRGDAFDVVYGQDVREWSDPHLAGETVTTRGKVVWRGSTPLAREWNMSLRLYVSSWANPRPGVDVTSIDHLSELAAPAPFLVAR